MEAVKILKQRQTTLQQMLNANIGGATEEGDKLKAELQDRLSNVDEALNLISSNPLVSGSVCCNAKMVKLTTYGYDECLECGKTYKQTDH